MNDRKQQTNAGDGDETRPGSTNGTVYKEVQQRLGDGRWNLSLFFQSIPTGALKTRLPCLRYELRPMAVKKVEVCSYRGCLEIFVLIPACGPSSQLLGLPFYCLPRFLLLCYVSLL